MYLILSFTFTDESKTSSAPEFTATATKTHATTATATKTHIAAVTPIENRSIIQTTEAVTSAPEEVGVRPGVVHNNAPHLVVER